MRLFQSSVVVQLLAARLATASPLNPAASPLIDIDPTAEPLDALAKLQQYAYAALEQEDGLAKQASGGCSLATATIRRDWQVYQTMFIHGNGLFLTWHRYFVWDYEQASRTECGYTGCQPYWNWFSYTSDFYKSPVFDGSDTSMGSDGAFLAHNGSLAGARTISIPSGKGGGCIESGPFEMCDYLQLHCLRYQQTVSVQANIGPISPGIQGITDLAAGITPHNPRCLCRDLRPYIPQKWFTTANLLNGTIGAAPSLLDRDPRPNRPPTRNATIEEPLQMGVNGETKKTKDMLDTLGGTPLCYIYV
ncbi:hypothetical protein E8E11_009359 [Didymella keratinophila]|nr:hypothetical protein E8E11_009359 [Didymella keratinophila]